ncbi:WXG100 family type VII secretion target [Amycolatopsis pigmentata]|uniref:WXG100 family type VII secretion target n=1 Tax=Amycolatopsis pigmentata TaxID=450801 RepID=A0ABW5FLZ5_9PSEU
MGDSGYLPYNTHRKHRYYSQDHPETARQRRRDRRIRRMRAANAQDKAFGKINWDAYTHPQLYDMVTTADPAAMGGAAHRWAQLALSSDSTTAEVHKTVQKLLLSWRGESAVRAADSASKLTRWAAEASSTMRGVGDGLDTYTSAVVEARNRMPEPVYYSAERHFRQGYDVKESGPAAAVLADQLLDDHLPTRTQADRAKAEAVRVMEQYESTSKGVHDTLPAFADAPEATSGSADGTDGSGEAGADGRRGGTVASGFAADVPGSDLPGGGGYGSAGGAGYGSGYGAGAGAGIGAGGLSAGGKALGALGASEGMPGAPGQPGMVAGAPGARGAAGGAGMYPPGAGQRNDEDGEHHNRYAEDMGIDMLEDLPPAYPPVLGE